MLLLLSTVVKALIADYDYDSAFVLTVKLYF
jgi:hypothetical protein